jgi:hypothetical protein
LYFIDAKICGGIFIGGEELTFELRLEGQADKSWLSKYGTPIEFNGLHVFKNSKEGAEGRGSRGLRPFQVQ